MPGYEAVVGRALEAARTRHPASAPGVGRRQGFFGLLGGGEQGGRLPNQPETVGLRGGAWTPHQPNKSSKRTTRSYG